MCGGNIFEQRARSIVKDSFTNAIFIPKSGDLPISRVVGRDELEEMGYMPPDDELRERDTVVYVEGYAEPVDDIAEIDVDWTEELRDAEDLVEEYDEVDEPHEIPTEIRMSGFTPGDELKLFRDQKAANEVFHRKTESPAPWRLLVGLGLVIGAVILATQFGII